MKVCNILKDGLDQKNELLVSLFVISHYVCVCMAIE